MLWTVRGPTVDVKDHESPQFRSWELPPWAGVGAPPEPGVGADSVLASAAASIIVRCMDDEELLRLSNHHASLAPVIEERPGRYLGYFENKFGEQLVFVHDDGESDAVALLGDFGWEPCRVSDVGGLPDAGDLILNDEERAFVNACWIATRWRREAARPAARHGRDDLPDAPAGG
jgi:hypothetical protein